jgi:hypothetical protein
VVEKESKQGREPEPAGGTVWVRTRRTDDVVPITVADDGEGFNSQNTGTGIGLKNVRERLQLVCGGKASLAVVANFPSGVAATIKHFPGHGDTDTDSHLALPTVPGDGAKLRRVELLPFQRAIAAGLDAVMTGHLAVPGLGEAPEAIPRAASSTGRPQARATAIASIALRMLCSPRSGTRTSTPSTASLPVPSWARPPLMASGASWP